MSALIDGDILVYVIGYGSNNTEARYAESRALRSFNSIIEDVGADSYRMFLSDSSGNFRNSIFPAYKGNRTQPKPVHYEHLSNYLLGSLKAEISWGQEADDAIGIASRIEQEDDTNDTVIISIDKDLYQIPGLHYNWRTKKYKTVTKEQGRFNFWKQVLTGDATDNITPSTGLSCPGVGLAKATKYLEGCETDTEYYEEVVSIYKKYLPTTPESEVLDRLHTTAKLVKIRTYENEIWEPPL